MNYKIIIAPQAEEDLRRLKKSEPRAFAKAGRIMLELMEHPQTGIGKPERLLGSRSGQWSRRINKKHRLIYEIAETIVTVYILSSYGHYDD
ncbi:MAG: Txe/YoeB family addiction module toxin [Bacteroidales bacterium]|nr:Txe/YoeB family addiction module toxin [Bacteroidales bacterium]